MSLIRQFIRAYIEDLRAHFQSVDVGSVALMVHSEFPDASREEIEVAISEVLAEGLDAMPGHSYPGSQDTQASANGST